MDERKIYSDNKKSIKFLLIAIIFVFGGFYMVIKPETFENRPTLFVRTIGFSSILFFGLGIYVFTRNLIKKQLVLTLDKEGIIFSPGTKKEIYLNWKSVQGFSEVNIYGQSIIIFNVNDSQSWIHNEKNLIIKKMMEFNFKNYNSPFNISENALDVNTTELLHLLNTYLLQSKTKL